MLRELECSASCANPWKVRSMASGSLDDHLWKYIWIYLLCCDYVWTGMHAAFDSGIYKKILYKKQSGTQREKKNVLTLTLMLVRRKSACKTSCRKSAVHRSAIRSNASSKFLQNYAGKRVRQPRTPNTSAERKFTNLIKLKQYRVKRIVSPSTPTCWRQASSFRSRRNTISHGEHKHNKQKNEERNKGRWCVPCVVLSYVKLCDTAALVH